MTTSVRLCLSYNHFRLDIIAFKVDNFFNRKYIVIMDVVMTLFASSGVRVGEESGVGALHNVS